MSPVSSAVPTLLFTGELHWGGEGGGMVSLAFLLGLELILLTGGEGSVDEGSVRLGGKSLGSQLKAGESQRRLVGVRGGELGGNLLYFERMNKCR